MTSSTQAQGYKYRVKTLYLLARLGYASTRQIARAVWGKCNLSTRKMAARTLRHLLKAGHIVARRDAHSVAGEQLVALTRSGISALTESITLPGNRVHARDWLRHAHKHRTAANSAYAAFAGDLLDLDIGWTELEIRSGDAPPELALFKFRVDGAVCQKIPDVLFDFGEQMAWVEVENNWRSTKDFVKLIGFLRAMFAVERPLVGQVTFIITTSGAKTIGDRLQAALTHDDPLDGTPRQMRELDARILAHHIQIWKLDHDSLELEPVPLLR